MLGYKDKQRSFDDQWLENRIPKDSYWHKLKTWVNENLRDSDFQELFSQYGRPSVSPVITFSAILIQLEKGYSDVELEEESRFDDRVKYALDAGRNYEGLDAVTLHDHRKRFFENELGFEILAKTLASAKDADLFSQENIHVVDSFMVQGAAQKQDTYTLLYQGIKMALKIADCYAFEGAREILKRKDYDQKQNKPRINWEDADAKHTLLNELVQDAQRLVDFLKEQKPFTEELEYICELLKRLATQDIEEDGSGQVKIKNGTCKDRIVSVNDPQMRHGRQSRSRKIDGYKTEILTGGPKADLVVSLATDSGNTPDGSYLDQLLTEAFAKDVQPREILGDSKYTDWEKIERWEEKELTFCTKSTRHKNQYGKFSKEDFAIDLPAGEARCPSGVKVEFDPQRIYQEHKRTYLHFPAKECNRCSFKEKCTTSKNGRSVVLNGYENRLQKHRSYQKTQEFKEKYARRANGERTIAHLKRHGARRSRYFGRFKTYMQQLMAAINHNIKTVMGYRLSPT